MGDDNWTDGTYMPFEVGVWHTTETDRLPFIESLPHVSREEIAKIALLPGETNQLWKLRKCGDSDAYAKIYCGHLGYYLVCPTYQECV